MNNNLGFSREVPAAYREVIPIVMQALHKEGFDVLSTINVEAILKEKLEIDHRPYVLLSVCKADLAHQLLQAGADLGLMLLCQVAVGDVDGAVSTLSITDPLQTLGKGKKSELQSIIHDLSNRLWRIYLDVVVNIARQQEALR